MIRLAAVALVAAGTVSAAPAADLPARAPLPSEVSLTVFQYATGAHSLPVTCGPEGHENTGPVTNLVIDRPFVFRLEPRWRGGRQALDVIFEPKVYLDVTGQVDRATWTVDDATTVEGDSQWTQLVHLGAQSGNREMAQIDQDVTFGHGDLLHPMKTAPTKYDFQVDFQLGKQVGPKLVCEAEVRVWRAGDPNIPAGAEVG
jgi:hypothetical protein